ncbi:MAG: hypothetical protein PHO08_09535 [Methylococcales bacterium]|nr:hypothetical protein [Methylococcales bacterium]MDD5633091.1 hypothetical protein [Methylococcales bacterium]
MFSILRKFLVIFLTMLQFFAPLVHAHASKHISTQGLHVPGLEHYGAELNTLKAQMKALQYSDTVDGIIIGVNTGFKQNQMDLADSDSNFYLHQQTVVFNPAISGFDSKIISQPQQLVYRLFSQSHPPRAPPAQ